MSKYPYTKTFTFDGRKYKVYANSKSELAVKVAMRRRDLEEGKRSISKNMLTKDWAKIWVDEYKAPTVSASTLVGVRAILNASILPAVGSMPLKAIRHIHCQRIITAAKDKSRSHMNKLRYYMCDLFDAAIKNHLLIENPAADLDIPKTTAGTHRALTDAERAALLSVCESNPYGLWVLVMLYCGLRPGETERIQGRHIDLKKRLLHVDGTKTTAAKRDVPINEILAGKLAEAKVAPFDYLFKNSADRPINKTNRKRMWESITKDMHIKMGGAHDYGQLKRILPPYAVAADLVPYCLRHTFCTDLQSAGVPINVAKELMGHTSIEMTARVYTHSSADTLENAREKMNIFTIK
jgi:integrase